MNGGELRRSLRATAIWTASNPSNKTTSRIKRGEKSETRGEGVQARKKQCGEGLAEPTALETNMKISVSQKNILNYIMILIKSGVKEVTHTHTHTHFTCFRLHCFSLSNYFSFSFTVPRLLSFLSAPPLPFLTHNRHTRQIGLFSILARSLISPFPRTWGG